MRSFHERELPRLLDLLYDAALDPERWQAFLDALPGAFGGAWGVLHSYDVATAAAPSFRHFGDDPAFNSSYADYFHSINPYPPARFEAIPVGKVIRASDFLDAEFVERTEFYADFMKPLGITADHLGVSLHNDGNGVTLLAICPHASVYRKNRETYEYQFALLVPHLMRAVEINRVMAAARTAERALGTSLDALKLAAFVVDGAGRLLLANQKAEDLLRRESVLRTDHSKRLRAANCTENVAFEAAISHAFRPPTALTTQPVRLTSRASGQAFIAWAVPMRSEQPNGPNHRSQFMLDLRGETTVLVLVVAAECALSIPPEAIQAAFKLSAAEARLVSALIAGQTLAEYARDSGHSRNTVRNQLASALEKTDTRRQAELVAAIVGTLGILGCR
ncbi:helix-turn-helix transcriptional regulator [Bradyrhizobium sp. AUGA SZCCT0240]|uniref:helix-turn-helix transcriptional regulator n=1 Tax=unclassified Bradyrhizobium TaxID=2631580 RepID=UPI001BAD0DF5|nr:MULTISPECIES: helix-turn-helix transcriptional regulator [unclassified Bradyrhizobium]MBR1196468.1 helix-turn-helix transcriptional regulator [Bradyrhizobium sp. AUGA SZCCT0158]MBR1241574.1 helix-turn-helix transcriptional regulator [Bradyrhizobium sp. AUGA SZCCT0274]MBR1254686.1 helix-turn-helix transcriptional regulator [Bradyrhizobium sp. AUGA SZCCT0240]